MANGGVDRAKTSIRNSLRIVNKFAFKYHSNQCLSLKKRFFFNLRMQSVQNLGLALISLLTGIIVDEAGYFILESWYLILV